MAGAADGIVCDVVTLEKACIAIDKADRRVGEDQQMDIERIRLMNQVDRRKAIATGTGLLAAIAGLKMTNGLAAQDPPTNRSRWIDRRIPGDPGLQVAPDADVSAFLRQIEGFVEIIEAVPGFFGWSAFLNDETRDYVAVSTFDTKENSDASTAAAAQYVSDNALASYLIDPQPVVIDGQIVLAAGM